MPTGNVLSRAHRAACATGRKAVVSWDVDTSAKQTGLLPAYLFPFDAPSGRLSEWNFLVCLRLIQPIKVP